MWWPDHIPAGAKYDEMMSHIDCWATLATMVGLTPPPHGEWKDNNGKPIYFDSIDNSAYILGQGGALGAEILGLHRWRELLGARADIGGDPKNPDVNIAWKYLGLRRTRGSARSRTWARSAALYNLTMDPFEKYDMTFNGAMSSRLPQSSPGKYAGEDNGWVLSLVYPALIEFDKSIVKYPSIKRFPGGASNDLMPNLQNPENPVPVLDPNNPPQTKAGGG